MKINVYTRQGCHLCEEAFALLEKHQSAYLFEIEAVDIDTDTNYRRSTTKWSQ